MLAPSLVRCDRVIVIGGEFLVDEMGAGPFRFRCDAIHGAEDDVVVPARARAAHARLLAGGSQGEFVE
ncbi:MAG: hypothetical protein ACXWPM_07380, partial [Bdellovibrionota bacterium]